MKHQGRKPTETAARTRQRAAAWKAACDAWRAYADGRGSWSDAVHAESNALAFELQGKRGETRPVVPHPAKPGAGQAGADKDRLSAEEFERVRRIDFEARWTADDGRSGVIDVSFATRPLARRAWCADCGVTGVTLHVPPPACPSCGSRQVYVGPPTGETKRPGDAWPPVAGRRAPTSGQNLARGGAPVTPLRSGEVVALAELQKRRAARADGAYAGPVDYLGGRGDAALKRARGLLGEHVGVPVICPSCGTKHALESAGLCPSCGAPVLVVRDPPAAVRPSAPSAAAPGGAPAAKPGRGGAPLGKIANSVSRANARTDGSQDGGPRPLPWSPDAVPSLVPAADCWGRCECGALRLAGQSVALCPGCEAFVEWLVKRGGVPS